MPIDPGEWDSIAALAQRTAEKVFAGRDTIAIGVVERFDEGMGWVYLEGSEIGVAVFGFEWEVTYYDETSEGMPVPVAPGTIDSKVKQKKAKLKLKPPEPGDYVLLLNELGQIPRCLGVLLSAGFADDPNLWDE
jgi:hypothetical protein